MWHQKLWYDLDSLPTSTISLILFLVCGQQEMAAVSTNKTLREPLTDFLHQHLTDVKNKGTLSDQMSPSLSTEPNCSPGLCSARIRFLTSSPLVLPKAETILKSNPYFHQKQCSDSFKFPLYGYGCNILVATSEIRHSFPYWCFVPFKFIHSTGPYQVLSMC